MFENLDRPFYAKALLFDMDGTLLDSTESVERMWRSFANLHGLDLDEILAKDRGRRTFDTVAFFAPKHIDVQEETARLTALEIADTKGVKAIAGAREFLQAILLGKWAIVTSAHLELATSRMNAAGLPIPKVLITAEDVKQGKPSPEGYLLAAQKLQVAPEECIIFEDAPSGITAAVNAGIRVIAVGEHIKTTHYNDYNAWISDFTSLELKPIVIDKDPRLIEYKLMGKK